jgi:hypothetical protein
MMRAEEFILMMGYAIVAIFTAIFTGPQGIYCMMITILAGTSLLRLKSTEESVNLLRGMHKLALDKKEPSARL